MTTRTTLSVLIVKNPETYMDLLYAFETGTRYEGSRVIDYREERTQDGLTEACFTLEVDVSNDAQADD